MIHRLNPVLRTLVASFGLMAGTVLMSSAAHATTSPASSGPVTPLTFPLSAIGGESIDLTHTRGTFDPTWLGNASNYYTSVFDISGMLKGGTLLLTQASDVTFKLVGVEAGFNNAFVMGAERLDNRTGAVSNLGDSFSFNNLSTGVLNFGFLVNGAGSLRSNGHSATGIVLSQDYQSALVFFNDRFGDRDFDDMIVEVTITAVPEPEFGAMLVAGLGLLSLMARRRQRRT